MNNTHECRARFRQPYKQRYCFLNGFQAGNSSTEYVVDSAYADDQLISMLKHFNKSSSLFWIIIGYMAIFCIGIVDTLRGSGISFSLFYLIPIMFYWSNHE
jgi:hypothetical protein